MVQFLETTTGYRGLVDGKVSWFIRKEDIGWCVYRSDDGTGFVLVPSNDSKDTSTWGHSTLESSKQFVIMEEQD